MTINKKTLIPALLILAMPSLALAKLAVSCPAPTSIHPCENYSGYCAKSSGYFFSSNAANILGPITSDMNITNETFVSAIYGKELIWEDAIVCHYKGNNGSKLYLSPSSNWQLPLHAKAAWSKKPSTCSEGRRNCKFIIS